RGSAADVGVLEKVERGLDAARAEVGGEHEFGPGLGRPKRELVETDLVGLDGVPRGVESPRTRLARPDAVLPAVRRDEVAARVAHGRHAQLAHEIEYVRAEAIGVGGR